jgi:predicted secreted protein
MLLVTPTRLPQQAYENPNLHSNCLHRHQGTTKYRPRKMFMNFLLIASKLAPSDLSANLSRVILPAAILVGCLAPVVARADPSELRGVAAPNVVSLSASGFLEVAQDWLTLRMNTTREGSDAASVQSQLKVAMDNALIAARAAAAADQQLQVRSGAFGVYPRYEKNGKISGWQGNAELIMEGRDFTRIARTAGQIQTLTVAGMDFSLSREAQQRLESDAQALAIERFKSRATEVAKGFGFTDFSLREINISSADQIEGRMLQRSAMAMDAQASFSKSEPLAVEPGNSKVNVTVSGTVQLK